MQSDVLARLQRKRKRNVSSLLFYVGMCILPLAQFFIFYILVNFNTILLAFKSYQYVNIDNTYKVVEEWIGLGNFHTIINTWNTSHILQTSLKNSLVYAVTSLFVCIPLSLLFAYYIVRRYRLANFFKAVLFLPSIVCSMVFVIFYMNLSESLVPEIAKSSFGVNLDTAMKDRNVGPWLLLFFYVWISFSGSILLYVDALNAIPESRIEAAKIDGCGELGIFWHVVLPGAWGTISSLIIVSLTGVVANQAFLFDFFGMNAPASFQTLGYYQFALVARSGGDDPTQYPLASTYGLLFTLIATPLTLIIRKLLKRFGPSEE